MARKLLHRIETFQVTIPYKYRFHLPKPKLMLLILGNRLSRIPLVMLSAHAVLAVRAIDDSHGDVGSISAVAVGVQLVGGDKAVEPARKNEAQADDEHHAVGDGEGEDVERVVALLVEGWVGERGNDGQDRGRDVAEADAPDERDAPVLAGRDGDVEITAELVAL